ncbi:hypothetical protein FHS25_000526 [Rhizobium laguerreae]|uniref:Lipoprotein n=1 Tax=Rhizobium laguerreae TaxID=1076926 RepID=A0ABR6G1F3_9HYPH|nr:hypothetical protein [Rhizobium laguerreae]
MKIKFLVCAVLLALAGCQTPAPQSVLDSQQPPSSAVRRENVEALRGTIKPGNFVKAEISSVVLLNPEKQILCLLHTHDGTCQPELVLYRPGLATQHDIVPEKERPSLPRRTAALL